MELIDKDDADGDELMDVDIPSPKGRKRDRAGDNGFVRFYIYRVYFLIDITYVIGRETNQTLTGQAVSQVAYSARG